MLDDGQSVAFLSANEPEILVYYLNKPAHPVQRIQLPEPADEMTFSDGSFYVCTGTPLYKINRLDGRVELTMPMQRPEGQSYVVHQLRTIDSQLLLCIFRSI